MAILNSIISGLAAPVVDALARRFIVGPWLEQQEQNRYVNFPLQAREKLAEQAKTMMAGPEYQDQQNVARNPMLSSIWANLTPEPASVMKAASDAQALPTAIDIARATAGLKEAEAGRERQHGQLLGEQAQKTAVERQLMPAKVQADIDNIKAQAFAHSKQGEALALTSPMQAEEHNQRAKLLAQQAADLEKYGYLGHKNTGVTAIGGILGNLDRAGINLTPDQKTYLGDQVLAITKGLAQEYQRRGAMGANAAPGQLPIDYSGTLMGKYPTRR